MWMSSRNLQSLIGKYAIAAISLVALTIPLEPAKAQGYIGFQFGPFGFGVGAPGPVYGYPYYPPAPAPAYSYYPGYYHPPY